MSDHRFDVAVADLERMDFERVPTLRLMRLAYELRANLTAYDATYVALDEALDRELVTGDQRRPVRDRRRLCGLGPPRPRSSG